MNNRKIIGLVLLTVASLLCSCVTSKKVNYMQKPDKHIPTYADTLSYADYVIRPGDRLYIYIYSLNEKISSMYNAGGNSSQMRQQMGNGGYGSYGSYDLYTYLVDDEGRIEFPTLGKIDVQGLSTREVKHKMEEEFNSLLTSLEGYSQVSVEVNLVQRTFSIIGTQSSRYPITKEKMTIFEALAQAHNLQDFSDRARIKLVRVKDGKTVIKQFDVRSEDIINSEFYYIEPGDILYVGLIPGQIFGISSFQTGIAVVTSTLSFGVFVYSLVQTGINHVQKYKSNH